MGMINRYKSNYFNSIIAAVSFILFFAGCSPKEAYDYSKYVDPFIGTGGHGHTFPGATLPFGLVQLSPDTGVEGWDWCSGYHESDSSIIGFSHTHLSGTGGADYGDILLMPAVGQVKYLPGTKGGPDAGYRSRFNKKNEKASPGYYAVHLDDYKVDVELTATLRTGIHQYTFPQSDQSHIILDLKHGISDNVRDSELKIISDTKVEGYRFSQGWANDQRVYFAIEFSKPFSQSEIAIDDVATTNSKQAKGKNIKGAFFYKTSDQEVILVKVALSSVSSENAWENMKAENKGFDFEKTHSKARKQWNKELAKIEVEGGTKKDRIVFYSAMYHTKIHPNIFQDVNGEYRGMDMKVHAAKSHTNYSLYSLWDTFRALHPLYSITDTKTNDDFIKSMMAKYEESGKLPVWELWSNETNTMIGYHSVPVISDAILKNYYTGNEEEAYKAMVNSAMSDGQGLKDYKHMNYIPREKEANSVSKTVEYAFDDYAIAQVAQKLGKEEDYKHFTLRSLNYQNVFDPETRFMRGRDENGVWNPDFDPMSISLFGSGDFTEGNSWHYSFFAPHDINGLIELYGGNEAFVAKLDEMFEQDAINDNDHAHDVTGLIGQYAQGNEPSHHVIYAYNFALRPDRAQELIRQVIDEMYSANPDGYSGNEDTGQMSAWYVFSSMGFYPINPVSDQFIIGSPLFDKVTINLENGKTFVIETQNNSDKSYYIKSATLNGKPYNKTFIKYADIMEGGHMSFEMSTESQAWGQSADKAPLEIAADEDDVIDFPAPKAFMPYPGTSSRVFHRKLDIELLSETPDVTIYYTLNGDEPSTTSFTYTKPITINKSTVLKAISIKKGFDNSDIKTIKFRKAIFNTGNSEYPVINSNVKLGKSYNPGISSLIDGRLGSNNYRDGRWTGVQGQAFMATINLGRKKAITGVTMNFMQNTGSWIFPPKSIKILGSLDGKTFKEITKESYAVPTEHLDILINTKSFKTEAKVQYLKVIIEGAGELPSWHSGAGRPSYIFIDEITIEQ